MSAPTTNCVTVCDSGPVSTCRTKGSRSPERLRSAERGAIETMRVLVTGGAGFIGSHIVDGLIAHGHDTYVVDDLSGGKLSNLEQARKEGGVTFHSYDIASEAVGDLFDQVRPEVVVHMAAQPSVPASVADPIFDAQVNIIGLLRILDACVASNAKKIVFAASGGTIYGPQDVLPVKETAVGRPASPYGI